MSEGIILQPLATLTSLPILLVGLYILWANWKCGRNLVLGFLVALTGLGSIIVHASFTKVGTYMDFSGIYLIFLWIFSKSLESKIKRPFPVFLALSTLCVSLLITLENLRFVVGVVCGTLGIIGFLYSYEFKLRENLNSYLKISLGVFVISVIVMALDQTRIWCHPDSWLQGHSLWHLGVAAVLWGFYQGLRQSDSNLC